MNIRPAEPKDVEIMFDVRTAVTDNAATRDGLARLGITPASVSAALTRGRYYGWIAEINDRPLGFALVDPAESYLFALFVHPDAQGRGVGTRLLAKATTFLFARGCKCLWLTTDGRSRAATFYRRRGWRRAALQPNGETRFELTLPTGPPPPGNR